MSSLYLSASLGQSLGAGVGVPTITLLNVTGQSNALGGNLATTPEAQDEIDDARVFQWSETGGGVSGDPAYAQQLLPYVYPMKWEEFTTEELVFPGTRYIQNWIASAGLRDRLVVIASARGSTGLVGGRWDPDTPGDLFTRMKDGVTNAAAAILAANPGATLKVTTLWQQGETDVVAAVTGPTYRTEVGKLIDGYRVAVAAAGVTDDVFLIGGMVPDWLATHGAYGVTFQENQIAVTLDKPRTFWIGPSDLGYAPSDVIHYGRAAYRELGDLYWAKRNRALALSAAVPAAPTNAVIVNDTDVRFEAVDCAVYAVEFRAVGSSGAWTRALHYEVYPNDGGQLITYEVGGSGDRDVRVFAVSEAGDSLPSNTVTIDETEVPITPAVWDAADAASSGFTLTDSSKTATKGAATAWKSLRADQGKASGKWYFEVECVAVTGSPTPYFRAGLANSAYDRSTYLGTSTGASFGCDPDGTTTMTAQFTQPVAHNMTSGNQTVGRTYGFHVDMDAGKIWISNNGAFPGSGDPSAGTNPTFTFDPLVTGALYPAISEWGPNSGSWHLNVTTAELTNSPDTGFTVWDGA